MGDREAFLPVYKEGLIIEGCKEAFLVVHIEHHQAELRSA
jgi:hypothetical protein